MEKFENVKCKKCGKEAEIKMENDGTCDDPDCCGEASYYIEIECECGEKETI